MKNYRVLMKITAVILSVATIYVVILWQPNDNSYDKVENNSESIEEQATTNEEIVNGFNNEGKQSDESIDVNEKSEDESQQVSSYVSVLNISFENIIQSLTNEEKESIKKIINKLSITDCNKVNNMLIQDDKEKAISEAFRFMKKRLSKNDYDQLQTIMKNYINFEAIENNV